MAAARRLYLYVLAGLGLGLILVGGITMLRLVFEAAGLPGGAAPVYEIPDPDADKAAFSQALAYLAVGLPIWLVHWGLIERQARRNDVAGAYERGSFTRALFFLVVLAYLLAPAAVALVAGLREWLAGPLGTQDPNYAYGYGYAGVAANLAPAVMLGLAWLYHMAIRDRDLRLGPPLHEGAARTFRLYVYGAALGALGVAIQAFVSLEATIGDIVAGHRPAMPYYGYDPTFQLRTVGDWWTWPVLSGVVTLAVVIPIWLGHLRYSDALLRPDRMGAEEAASRMRLGYFVAAIGIVVGTLVGIWANALTALFAVGLKAPDPNDYRAWQPLATAVVTGAAMLALLVWHRDRAVREAAGSAPGAPVPARAIAYGVALLGLAALAGGSFAAIKNGASALLGPAFDSNAYGYYDASAVADPRVWEVAVGLGYATVGLVVWAWSWRTCQGTFGRDRLGETGTLSRRLYLLVVSGGALIGLALGSATVIERVARLAVGLSSVMWDDAFSGGIAAVAVAVPVLVYHGLLLRADLATGRTAPAASIAASIAASTPVEPAAAPPQGLGAPATVARPGQTLVIVGPAGADMEQLRGALGGWLPPGFTVELRES
jgi:hypothetical protein